MIYINDVLELNAEQSVSSSAFVDDLKSYAVINATADCERFQNHLNAINLWAQEWQLSLAPDKCKIMHYRLYGSTINHQYFIADKLLENVNCIVDVGITFQPNLNFSQHITTTYHKARKCSQIILRSFYSRDPDLLFRAFATYVRPIIDYCSSL